MAFTLAGSSLPTIQAFVGALYGVSVGSSTMSQVNSDITTYGGLNNALNAYYSAGFGSQTTASVAATIVANVGLASDAKAIAYVTGQLNAAAPAARGAAVANILNAFAGLTSDATYGAAASAWGTTVSTAVTYAQTNSLDATTTTAAASVAAQTAATAAATAAAAAAAAIKTLSTSADVIPATASLTINGTIDAVTAANSTYTTADSIGAGAGSTLTLTVSNKDGIATAIPAAYNTGLTTINLRSINGDTAGTGTTTIDASGFSGVTAVNSTNSTQAITITNLAKGASTGYVGNTAIANGALTFGYVTGATAAVLNISGGTTGTTNSIVTLTGQTTLTSATVNNTGTNVAKTINVGGTTQSVTALTIANAGSLDVSNSGVTGFAGTSASITITGAGTATKLGTIEASTVKTIDSSAFAGALTATLNTAITSLKAGPGADVITTAATTASGAVIDGGAGTDTIVLALTNDVTTIAKGAQYVNFETEKSLVTSSVDASLIPGIVSLESAAAGAGFTNMSATQATSVKVSADQTATAVTYALANSSGTSDVLGLNFVNSPSTTVEKATALTVSGFETVNITAGSGGTVIASKTAGTDYDNFAFSAATGTKTVTLSGGYAAKVDISSNATSVTTFDASANTAVANLVTGGQTGALVVTGTAGADSITLGNAVTGGTVTLAAGAGNDTILTTLANAAAFTIDGGAGTDTLELTDAGAIVVNDNAFANITGVEKLKFDAVTGITLSVGGYANSLATANGGVLDISASALVTAAAGTTIDASGLGGTNSLKLSLTDTGGGQAISITGTAKGTDAITLTTATSHAGNITIDDSANKSAGVTIDASAMAYGSGTNNIKSGSGTDTIKGGAVATTITAGKGADTITLLATHAGVQTIYSANGDSTDTAYDLVYNYVKGQDMLTFTNSTTAVLSGASFTATNTGTTNLTATNSNGILTFGGTAASGLPVATAITATENILASSAAGTYAGFSMNGNTYLVETYGTGYTVVELVGTTSTALGSTTGILVTA